MWRFVSAILLLLVTTCHVRAAVDTIGSGSGLSGDDFSFQYNTLPGDANQDGLVNVVDSALIRDYLDTPSSSSEYDRMYDVDGSGMVQRSDVVASLRHSFMQSSSGPPSFHNPEPTSLIIWTLLGISAASMGWRRRYRR